MPSRNRITWDVIRSGQPAPYRDSEYVVQVTLEFIPYGGEAWEPWFMDAKQIKCTLRGIPGFVEVYRSDKGREWHQSYVDYIRPLDEKAYGNWQSGEVEMRASRWEFNVISPYTD